MASLAERAPDSQIELQRFRPNLVVDLEATGDPLIDDVPFPELDWAGRRIAIGGAILEATMACPRCVMVTRPVGKLPQDPRIMRTLVQETGGNFGVYARVEKPGPVSTGDPIRLL
jgi:uncharacterized protein YcbX